MSTTIADQLREADALFTAGRLGDAYDSYRRIFRAHDLSSEQRGVVELRLAQLTATGANQDAGIRVIAWLTLVASVVAAASAWFLGGGRYAFWWAAGWGLSGVCCSFLLLRFAELVDRTRAIEARLVVLSAKTANQG